MNRSSSSSAADTQACAVCRYQRRKCSADCILAPFFPADKRSDFLNAHKLFGVSNIIKIIRGLDSHTRSLAVNSIIYHANVRAIDPVGGCYRIITNLHRDIFIVQRELNLVRQQLAECRRAFHAGDRHLQQQQQLSLHDRRNGAPFGSVKPELVGSSSEDDVMIKPYFGDKAAAAGHVPLE